VISTTPERETGGELTMPDTVRLHRVLAMKREKVYRALIEPDPMVPTWQPGHFQAAPLWQPVVGWVDSAIERPLSATSLRGGSWPVCDRRVRRPRPAQPDYTSVCSAISSASSTSIRDI